MPAVNCSVTICGDPECLQLTEREAQVCMAVWRSEEPVAFSTVKKSLGFHQEVLSRILKRLVNYGAIEKARGKYKRVGQ